MRGLVVVAFLGLLFAARPAAAEDPNAVFGGRIVMSVKKFPTQAKSASAYIAAVKKLAMDTFSEDKSSHSYPKIYFTGFLKTPLNDVEYVVKVYEVTTKGQQLLVTFDQYTDTRGEKTISSSMTLDKNTVGANKNLLITMESKGKVLASARFKLLGEGEHYSGKIEFKEGEDDE